MKFTDIKTGDLVRVYWRDSTVDHGWHHVEEPLIASHIVTYGLVLTIDDDTLVISHTKSDTGNHVCKVGIPMNAVNQIERIRRSAANG